MVSAEIIVENIFPVDSITYGFRKRTLINPSVTIEYIHVII